MKATLRTNKGTKVYSMCLQVRRARVVSLLGRWRYGDGEVAVDEFGHKVERTVFGFGTARARGKSRAQCVEH